VVHNWDVVPSLSMGMLRDLRNIAVRLQDSPALLEECRRKLQSNYFSATSLSDEDEGYLYTTLSDLRREMSAEKLVPPGQVIVISSEEHFSVDTRVRSANAHEQRLEDVRVTARDVGDVIETRFREIWFAKGMFSDHSPKRYEFVLEALRRGIKT
jgi:hypothetical protein